VEQLVSPPPLEPFPEKRHRETGGEAELIFSFYIFIAPCSFTHLPSDDVLFLERRGCFKVPVPSILDVIVEAYFRHVQPHFPIFDEAIFWTAYNDGTNISSASEKWPLFTFYAFLCVASSVRSYIRARTEHKLIQCAVFGPAYTSQAWFQECPASKKYILSQGQSEHTKLLSSPRTLYLLTH